MKKQIKGYILLISILTLGMACRKPLKNVEDYFPKVTTVSAVVQSDGTVKVTGNIDSPGRTKGAAIDYAGFCVNTNPEPKMLEGQLIGELDGTTFTAVYPATLFNIDSTYYFRTWATNEYGYSYGNVIRLDSIITPTITPPCKLTLNTINIGGSTPTAQLDVMGTPDSDNSFSGYSFSGPSVSFRFGSPLTTGIFKTSDSSPQRGQVYVSFTSGALSSGSNVYVNRLSASKFEITICEAPWTSNFTTFYFNTHFTTPL